MSTTEPARPNPSLRIEELAITNFRTFRQRTVIPLAGQQAAPDAVPVFHGDNGAGKSNAMAALDVFFQTAALVLVHTRNADVEPLLSWDSTWLMTGRPDQRPVVLAYQDRPYGSEGPMVLEVSFADPRLGRLRVTCTPSGNQVRVQLERPSIKQPALPGSDGILFAAVPQGERDQLLTWLLTPRGPGSLPLTILDPRRRPQWRSGEGHRSLMMPDLAEALYTLQSSRRPEHRELWRAFVSVIHRFEAFRGKEVSMDRPVAKEDHETFSTGLMGTRSVGAPELVLEDRGRVVLGLEQLSSGEQQVIVLSAMALLANSGILAIQEPEISLDVKNQRLLRQILDEVVTRGLIDQVILESHVPTFDSSEVVRFARGADGTSEVTRAAGIKKRQRDIALEAKKQNAQKRWITGDGYTQVPDNMRSDLRLAGGGHVWFVKGSRHWEAWPETDLDELLGVTDEEEDTQDG